MTKMIRRIRVALLAVPLTVCLALLCPFTPAVAAEVRTWTAKGESFAQYKTYKMLPIRVLTRNGLLEEDTEYSPLISAAVRKELAAKGFTEVTSNEDLQVAAGAIGSVSQQIDAILYSFGIITNEGSASEMGIIGRLNREGTVVVNLVNPKTKKSVWFGLSKQGLGRPSQIESDVNKATADLFKKYPKK